MEESQRYRVIISDRAKRMLGTHIRFMAQVNRDAASAKKKQIVRLRMLLPYMLQIRGIKEWLEAYIIETDYLISEISLKSYTYFPVFQVP